jgi:branched-chain amino acid transport system ATP-binding protein
MSADGVLLSVQDLTVSYGSIRAVKGISFDVREGEIVTLIGANGAGKSSVLRAISGVVPYSGRVLYKGKDLGKVQADKIVALGISQVPEGRGIFGNLTVTENLKLATWQRKNKAEIAQDYKRVFALFPRLKERATQLGGTLSGGEQQMLAIGRAIMGAPKLLLLDEPSMGLAPLMVQRIFDTIRKVAAEGVTVLLVEQNAKLALEMSARGYVMESGQITLTDSASALLANPQVRQAYLGE